MPHVPTDDGRRSHLLLRIARYHLEGFYQGKGKQTSDFLASRMLQLPRQENKRSGVGPQEALVVPGRQVFRHAETTHLGFASLRSGQQERGLSSVAGHSGRCLEVRARL
jgi:hypothetical protein